MDNIGLKEYKNRLSKAFDNFEFDDIVFHNAAIEKKGCKGGLYYPVLKKFDAEPYNTWNTFCQLYAIKEYLLSHPSINMCCFVLLVVGDKAFDHRLKNVETYDTRIIFREIKMNSIMQGWNGFYKIKYSSLAFKMAGIKIDPQWSLFCGQYYENDEFFINFLKIHVAPLSQPKQIRLFEFVRDYYITRPLESHSILDELDIPTSCSPPVRIEKSSAKGNMRRYDWDKHTLAVLQQYIGEFKNEDEVFLLNNLKSFCGASELEKHSHRACSFYLNWNEKDLKKLYEYLYEYGYVNKELTTWEVFLYYMNGVGRKPLDKIIWERSAYDFYAFIECIIKENHSRPWKIINKIFSVPSSKSPIGNTGYQNARNSNNHDLNIEGFKPFMK